LAESGLFNGLQRIQIKKIFSPVTPWLRRKYHKSRFPFGALARDGLREARLYLVSRKILSQICFFRKQSFRKIYRLVSIL